MPDVKAPAAPKMVDVKGLPFQLPDKFDIKFDGANFNQTFGSTGTNGTNEGRASVSCDRKDTFRNDTFNINGRLTSEGYRLRFYINSEVATPLWDQGSVIAKFLTDKEQWFMSGWNFVNNRKWGFCTPDGAWAQIKSALECVYKEKKGPEVESLRQLMANIEQNKTQFFATAPKWERYEDACNRKPYSEQTPAERGDNEVNLTTLP